MDFIMQMEPDYGAEEKKAVMDYLDSGGFIMEFKKTRELEEAIAAYTGSKYCSIVQNGTISLFLALKAVEVGQDDEVIVPDYTMVATPNAAVLAGATPVFADVDQTLNLDPEKLEAAITKKTKAVIFVSINGRGGQLDKVKAICQARQLHLIEDAAQSLGSRFQGQHLGTYGVIGSLSFSVPKIITMGQGGALLTNDEKLYQKIRKLKDFGRPEGGADHYEEMGWNFKYTDLQSAFGLAQFAKLKGRVERKKEMWRLYQEGLKDVSRVKMIATDLTEVAPWFMEIFVPERDKLQEFLKDNNIGSRPIYPALHSQPVYHLAGSYPVSEKLSQEGLWLPSSTKLADDQIKYITAKIQEYYGQ
ncbi:MAG: DegT/DnrJ/EryC1/StrS aminotransferase family protein [Parcubacteria group bacterium GW2011_GWF2_45_11]|nr:MAG: DegT/DnrJ/EryC1/StrS aminotransferase family protein [Parcubacteria group bacterium GW2011_GWF2_45_11]